MYPTIAKILRPFRRSEASLKTNVSGETPVLAAGEPVSVNGADRALTLSTVWRCVQLISESVANLPLLHETLRDGAYRADVDELTRLMSVEPNEWTSGFDFWRQAVQTRLLFGEAYVVPQRDLRHQAARPARARLRRTDRTGPLHDRGPRPSAGFWKAKGVTGLSISISAEGLINYNETEQGVKGLMTAWKTGKPVEVKACERESDSTPYLVGMFVITSIEQSAPAQDDATYSISLENDGEPSVFEPSKITETAPATPTV